MSEIVGDMAAHLERSHRAAFATLRDLIVLQVGGALITLEPGAPRPEFASTARDRALWLTGDRPVGGAQINQAIAAARDAGRSRLAMWFAPWLVSPITLDELARSGATPIPFVEYVALACRADAQRGADPDGRPSPRVGPVDAREAIDVINRAQPWYGEAPARAARAFVSAGLSELFAAFDAEQPIALALLSLDGAWAHLSAAVVHPDHRGKGTQRALIRVRVARAASSRATWCTSETNTAVAISLGNLLACGFQPLIRWKVFFWDDPAPSQQNASGLLSSG